MKQPEIRKIVADRLKKARIDAGFDSPESFCQKHQIDLKIYISHETGKKVLRASQAMQYGSILNVSLQWIMLGDGWNERKDRKLRR